VEKLKKQVLFESHLRRKDDAQWKRIDKAYKVEELDIGPDTFFDDPPTTRIHRLDTMAGLTTEEQRDRVSLFLETYSNSSTWQTYKDPKIGTTLYIFDFDGSMWKTRISFLYPFVNYMTQVIGVNKKALGSLFVILPTSTVGVKINRLSNSFRNMLSTLEQHDSDSLWNYIFIFLKNVSTHYGYIKHYVGSRTRTIRTRDTRRRGTLPYSENDLKRNLTDSIITTKTRNKAEFSSQHRLPIYSVESKKQGIKRTF